MITAVVRPKTVREAVRAKSAPGAAYLGGGTWLNSGRAEGVRTLVSLENLGLDTIQTRAGGCVIGAAATFQALVDSAEIPPGLRTAAGLTASRTLRNMKRLGGELALRPDDSAIVAMLLALGAGITMAGKRRPIPVDAFLAGRPDGLILSISIPDASRPAAVRAVSRTSHSARSLVIAVSARAVSPALSDPRIVASDCRGMRVRLVRVEEALEGRPLPSKAEIEKSVRASFAPGPDLHGSAEYKWYMAAVLTADALHALAGGGARP